MSDQPPSNQNTQPGAAAEAQTHVLTPRVSSLFTRIFSTQRRNLKNFTALVIFNFIAQGIFFFTQVKIANVLGVEQYGFYALAMVIGLYGQSFVTYGADRTLVRDIIQQPARVAELITSSLFIRGVLMAVLVIALLSWQGLCPGPDVAWGVLLTITANSLKSMELQGAYDAWRQMGRHSAYYLLQRVIHFALIWSVILFAPGRLNLLIVGGTLLISQVLYLMLQHQWALRRIHAPRLSSALWPMIKSQLAGGLWLWVAAFVAMLTLNVNQIMLNNLSGKHELGLYGAANQLMTIFFILVNQVARVGSPTTAEIAKPQTTAQRRTKFLLRYLVVMTAAILPVCIVVYLFPDFVVHKFFKPEYRGAGSILRVLCIYAMLYAWGTVLVQYLVSVKMESAYLVCLVVSAALSIVCSYKLILMMGTIGAAWALVGVYSLNVIVYSMLVGWFNWRARRNTAISVPCEIPA